MICDNCKKNKACIHITQITGNNKVDRYLCEECATHYADFSIQNQSEGQSEFFSVNDFLSGVFHNSSRSNDKAVVKETPANEEYACPVCKMTYVDFTKTGKIGCSSCYDTFRNKLKPLLRRIHGSSNHIGKIPHRTGKSLNIQQKLDSLRKQIQQYVISEEYEKAAQVRDSIRRLENEIKAE